MSNAYEALDVMSVYLRDVAKYRVLSREDETKVGRAALANDIDAQQELVRANLRFVVLIAKQYQQDRVALLDLIQAGNIGLHHAAKRFDPSRNNRFITYAVHWIRKSIRTEMDATAGAVCPTRTQMIRVRRVRRLQADARRQLGRDLTVAELIHATGFTSARVTEALGFPPLIQSLDSPVRLADQTSTTLGQIISNDDARGVCENQADLTEATAKVLRSVLSPRERKILEEYFGFGDGRDVSLTRIAEMRGISRERVRQLKDCALRKLSAAVEYHPFLLEHFAPACRPRWLAPGRPGAD